MQNETNTGEVKRGTLADAIVAVTNEALSKSASIRVEGYVNSSGFVENVTVIPVQDFSELAKESLAWMASGSADALKPADVEQIAWDTAMGQTKESWERYLREGPKNPNSDTKYSEVTRHVKVANSDPGTVKVGPFRRLAAVPVGATKAPPVHRDAVTRSKHILREASPAGAYIGDLVLSKGKFLGYNIETPTTTV
jgi:hypothetical protein